MTRRVWLRLECPRAVGAGPLLSRLIMNFHQRLLVHLLLFQINLVYLVKQLTLLITVTHTCELHILQLSTRFSYNLKTSGLFCSSQGQLNYEATLHMLVSACYVRLLFYLLARGLCPAGERSVWLRETMQIFMAVLST